MTDTRQKPTFFQQRLATLINTTPSVVEYADQALATLFEDMALSNYYLVLHDANHKTLSFPYVFGKREFDTSCAVHSLNSPLKTVIEDQQHLIVEASDYLEKCDNPSEIKNPPSLWAGFPLMKDSEVFAILVCYAEDGFQDSGLKAALPFLEALPELFTPFLQTKIRMDILEESDQKFRRFVETSIDITFQVTREGILDYVSSNIKARFGIDPDSLLGRNISSITTSDEVPQVQEALKSIIGGKTLRNLAVNIQRSKGEIIPMEVCASPLFVGDKIIGAQGAIRDISERNKAQQEIERLAFFLLANPMPVIEVDLNGVPSYINPAGIQLLDQMNLDISQVFQILPKTFKADIKAALSKKSQSQIPSREVSLERLHLLWSAFLLQNQNLIHYYATDITNLKNTEAELISAKERALKNEEVKSLFLANMSHEIRTPLNSILGFTELIEEKVKDKADANLDAYFETIYMSGKRLWQTVHHVLDISQIETGTFELKTEKIDLGKIVKELGASFKPAALSKELELKVNVPKADIQIVSDEYCATQAISNLIDNAIKYTNSGHVILDTEVVDGSVRITIEDTGIGMSNEYQDHMFNVFSQESTGYTKNFQGMGLGLALAHRYLTLINGKIHFESKQDVGSKFTIFFPGDAYVSPTAELTEQSLSATLGESSVASRMSILVVEDDPNSQKLASFTLSKNYTLHFAESVADSKKMLKLHDIQMILLDLSLRGDEDGLDLARFLRAGDKWNKVPIVALTAHAFTSDKDRCMEAGCNDFMTKPFRLADLKETIQRLI